MSSLVQFYIADVFDDGFEVEVSIVHPDHNTITVESNYALQIIQESYSNIVNGYIYSDVSFGQHYPITQEQADARLTAPVRNLLSPLEDLFFGETFTLSLEEYRALKKAEEKRYRGKEIDLVWHDGQQYCARSKPEYDAYCELADQWIERVELLDLEDFPRWTHRLDTWLTHRKFFGFEESLFAQHVDDPDPWYALRVIVREPLVLEPLIKGARWESAAFSLENEVVESYRPKYTKINRCVLDPAPNFEAPAPADLRQWWQRLSPAWKRVLHVNFHLQRLHTFDIIHRYDFYEELSVIEANNRFDADEQLSDKDLAQLVRMQAITALGSSVESLEPLTQLSGLRIVTVGSEASLDVQPLAALKHLVEIDLQMASKLTNIASIAALPHLMHLYANLADQHDMNALATLKSLRAWHGWFDGDLSPLLEIQTLKWVSGYSNVLTPENAAVFAELNARGVSIDWEQEEGDGVYLAED